MKPSTQAKPMLPARRILMTPQRNSAKTYSNARNPCCLAQRPDSTRTKKKRQAQSKTGLTWLSLAMLIPAISTETVPSMRAHILRCGYQSPQMVVCNTPGQHGDHCEHQDDFATLKF